MKLPIHVSDAVFGRLAEIRASRQGSEPIMLRLAVLGGGCSGFQYEFSIDPEIAEDDEVIAGSRCAVVIDPVSRPFLEGATVDFEDALIGARFVVNNPNAISSCGCGTSFSM